MGLERNQWLGIGILSGMAYLFGKERGESESFDGEWNEGVLGDFEGHEEGKLGADKVATYTLDNGKIVEVYECYTIMNKEGMMTGKRIDFYDLFDKEGCLNEGEPWWPEGGVPSREVVNDVFGAESFEAEDFTTLPKPNDDIYYKYGDLICLNCGTTKIENLWDRGKKFCDRWSEKPRGECASKPESVRVIDRDRNLIRKINEAIYGRNDAESFDAEKIFEEPADEGQCVDGEYLHQWRYVDSADEWILMGCRDCEGKMWFEPKEWMEGKQPKICDECRQLQKYCSCNYCDECGHNLDYLYGQECVDCEGCHHTRGGCCSCKVECNCVFEDENNAESFEAGDTKYADIEKLLESDEDVFLGTGDGFKPDHPQKERIIEYLTQGGGGQTPYRVCFTCSVVTPDWLLINEGYECMPCSEINRTDYEKRKWGSDAESFGADECEHPNGWEVIKVLSTDYPVLLEIKCYDCDAQGKVEADMNFSSFEPLNAESFGADTNREMVERIFVVSDAWFDTYDEEMDDDSFYDKYDYKQSYDQPEFDEEDMTVSVLAYPDDTHDDLSGDIADALSNSTGFGVYHFNFDEILSDGTRKPMELNAESLEVKT